MADIKLIVDVDDDGKIKKTSEGLEDLGKTAKKAGTGADSLGESFAPDSDLLQGTFSFGEATEEVTGELGMMFEQMAGGAGPIESMIGMVAGLGGVLGPIGSVAVPAIIGGLVALAPLILENTDAFKGFGEMVEKAGEAMDGAVSAIGSWQTALEDNLGPEITSFSKSVLRKELIESSEEATKVIAKMSGQFESMLKKMKFGGKDVHGTEQEKKRMETLATAIDKMTELGDIDTSNVKELKDTLNIVTMILDENMSGALDMNQKQMDSLVEYGRKLQEMIEQIGDSQAELNVAMDQSLDKAARFGQKGTIGFGSPDAFANGGVVNRTTSFMQSNGSLGIMGEAGPEAILPLKRGANGKLGVQVEGSTGGSSVIINQSFNFSANGDDSVKRIIANEAPKIAKMTEQQLINSRQRGGNIRRVFG